MPESAPRQQAAAGHKRGLRGWRAFLVVFASGTLAAFLVFGLIVGALRLFVSTISDGMSGDSGAAGDGAPQQTGKPHSEVPAGKLDICKRTLPTTSGVQLRRMDDGENYHDDAEAGSSEIRMVRDNCKWELVPSYNSINPWDFEFEYEVFMESPDMGDRDERAMDLFEEWKGESSSGYARVLDEGESDYSDDAYSVYGEPESGDSGLTTVVRTRSAVYKIVIAGDSDEQGEAIPRGAFEHEVEAMVERLQTDFYLTIPE